MEKMFPSPMLLITYALQDAPDGFIDSVVAARPKCRNHGKSVNVIHPCFHSGCRPTRRFRLRSDATDDDIQTLGAETPRRHHRRRTH